MIHTLMLFVFVAVALTGRPPGAGSLAQRKAERKVFHWVVGRLKRLHPHLAAEQYSLQLGTYATLHVVFQRLSKRLVQAGDGGDGLFNAEGEVKSSVDSVRRSALALAVLARELGITPTTRASVAKEADAARFDEIRQAMQSGDHDEAAAALPAPEGEKSDD